MFKKTPAVEGRRFGHAACASMLPAGAARRVSAERPIRGARHRTDGALPRRDRIAGSSTERAAPGRIVSGSIESDDSDGRRVRPRIL
ncbi:hypothetical protein [Burkholderia pyrrocinia]